MVAAARRDGPDPAVTGTPATYTVDVPGGRLVITERPDGEVEMTGPAVIVAEGASIPPGSRGTASLPSVGPVRPSNG